MLITCPNCQTRYEIDENHLKDSQGALQCSQCGNVWSVPVIKPLILKPVEKPAENPVEAEKPAAPRFAVYPVEEEAAPNSDEPSSVESDAPIEAEPVMQSPSETTLSNEAEHEQPSLSEDEQIAQALEAASASFPEDQHVADEGKDDNQTVPDFEFVSAAIDRLSEKARKDKGIELAPSDEEAEDFSDSEHTLILGPSEDSHLDDLLSKSHIISFVPPLGAPQSANMKADEPSVPPQDVLIEGEEIANSADIESVNFQSDHHSEDAPSQEKESAAETPEPDSKNESAVLSVVRNSEEQTNKQNSQSAPRERNIDKAYAKRIERAVSKSIVYAPSFDNHSGQSTSSKKSPQEHSQQGKPSESGQSIFHLSNVVGFALFLCIFLGLAGYYADWLINVSPSLEPFVTPFQNMIGR